MTPSVQRGPTYLTMAALATKLGYRDGDSAAKWVAARGLPVFWRSQKVKTVREEDVDRAMAGESFGGRG